MILNALIVLAPQALGASISGEVLSEQGTPIAGATVAAVNPWFSAVRTTTDASGSYTIDHLDPGDYRIGVAPSQDDPHLVRYFPEGRSYCDGENIRLYAQTAREDVSLLLPKGARITGQLVDQDGAPISDAGLSASPLGGIGARRSTTTDDNGQFTLRGLDVADGGDSEWLVKSAVSGWPVQWLGPSYTTEEAIVFSVNAHGTTDIGTHALLDGILVSGLVTDEAGPVPDATVRVYSSGQLIQTPTDESGRYTVVGLPPGEVVPWAAADGRGVTYLPDADRPTEALLVEEGETADDGDIEMPPEARFTVALSSGTESDLAEASILLYNDTHTVGRGANADADGIATIDQLHGGEYNLFIYGADAGLADAWVRDDDGALRVFSVDSGTDMPTVSLELSPSVRIEGLVIDEEGVPVANTAIIASPPDAGPLADSENSFFTHTDGTGWFTLAGLPSGDWRVRAYVEPRCPSDPGFVPVYWPQQINPSLWEATNLQPNNGTHSVRFELPMDDDHDLMGDRWERRHGLDDTENDATLDPDEDGLSNLDEYRLGRDPMVPDGEWVTVRRCGCASAPTPSPLWLIVLGLVRRRRAEPTCSRSGPQSAR